MQEFLGDAVHVKAAALLGHKDRLSDKLLRLNDEQGLESGRLRTRLSGCLFDKSCGDGTGQTVVDAML
jgi:hypothetical protein